MNAYNGLVPTELEGEAALQYYLERTPPLTATEAAAMEEAAQQIDDPPVATEMRRQISLQNCAICLEPMTGKRELWHLADTVKLPCGHEFHRMCVHEWNTTANPNCAVCRKPIADVNAFWAMNGHKRLYYSPSDVQTIHETAIAFGNLAAGAFEQGGRENMIKFRLYERLIKAGRIKRLVVTQTMVLHYDPEDESDPNPCESAMYPFHEGSSIKWEHDGAGITRARSDPPTVQYAEQRPSTEQQEQPEERAGQQQELSDAQQQLRNAIVRALEQQSSEEEEWDETRECGVCGYLDWDLPDALMFCNGTCGRRLCLRLCANDGHICDDCRDGVEPQ